MTKKVHNDDRMECPVAVQALLPWYINGTLSGRERDQVVRHLATCDTCRTDATQWQTVAMAIYLTQGRETT